MFSAGLCYYIMCDLPQMKLCIIIIVVIMQDYDFLGTTAILIPFHLCESHWVLVVVWIQKAYIKVYNSISSYKIGIKGPIRWMVSVHTVILQFTSTCIFSQLNRLFLQYMSRISEARYKSLFDFERYSFIEEVSIIRVL